MIGCLCFAIIASGMAAAPDVPCLSGIGVVSVSAEEADPAYVSEVDLSKIIEYNNGSNVPAGVTVRTAQYDDYGIYYPFSDVIEIVLNDSGTYKFKGSNYINGSYVDVKIIVPSGVTAAIEFSEGSTIKNDSGDYKNTGGRYYSETRIGGDCRLCDYAVPFRVETGGSLKVTGDLSVDTYSYYSSCEKNSSHGKHGNSVPLYEGTGTFTADYFTVKYVDEDGLTIDEQYFLNKPADDQKYYLNKPADPVK